MGAGLRSSRNRREWVLYGVGTGLSGYEMEWLHYCDEVDTQLRWSGCRREWVGDGVGTG